MNVFTPVAGFSPEMISGFSFYLDGEESGALLAETGLEAGQSEPVATWASKNGVNATQPTLARRPTMSQRGNGLKGTAHYSANDQRLTVANGSAINSAEVTVFVVCEVDGQTQTANFKTVLNKTPNVSGQGGWLIQAENNTTNFLRLRADSDTQINQIVRLPNAADGQPHVIAMRWGGGQIIGNIDGGINYSAAAVGTSISGPSDLIVGGTTNSSFTGRIAAVMIYNRALTDGETTLVSDYLYRRHIARQYNICGPLLNGNFETAGTGGADTIASWTEQTSGTSTITLDTTNQRGGLRCAALNVDATGGQCLILQTPLTVGRRYRLTFWAKINATGGGLSVGGSAGAAYLQINALNTTWTQYDVTFTAINGSNLVFSRITANSRTIYLDDVILEDLSPTAEKVVVINDLIQNGDFEIAGTGAAINGGTDFAAGWTPYIEGTGNSIVRYTGDFLSGKACALMTTGTTNARCEFYCNVLTVGKKYRLTFWAKRTDSNNPSNLLVGNTTTVYQAFNVTQNIWNKYAVDFIANSPMLRFSRGATNQTMYIDGIELYEYNEIKPVEKIVNGSFEDGLPPWAAIGTPTASGRDTNPYLGTVNGFFVVPVSNAFSGMAQDGILTIGERYRCRVALKVNTGTATIQGGNVVVSNATVGTNLIDVAITSVWTVYEFEFTALSQEFGFKRATTSSTAAGKTVCIDECSVWRIG